MTTTNKIILACCLIISAGSVISNNPTINFQTILAVSMAMASTVKAYLQNPNDTDAGQGPGTQQSFDATSSWDC